MFKIKTIIKTITYYILLRFIYIFPIKKNKIMFESFFGKGMNCNPYYIYKVLKQKNPQLKFIWVLNNKTLNRDGVKSVKKFSLGYFYHLLTCKVYITNHGINNYIPFRKKQLVIDTWHGGGAYKKTGVDFSLDKTQLKTNSFVKYVLSSSKKFSDIFPSSRCYTNNQLLEIGLPRNDIFFNNQLVEKVNIEVRKFYNISNDTLILLYAPTFRGADNLKSRFETTLDYELVKKMIEKKFNKKCVIFLRFHVGQTGTVDSNVINVSDYPDMQELLCASNIFITDYSSCMWDFALTYKPGFLFTPDIAQYESERGVYTSVSSWPYPYAKTNEELCILIKDYDFQKAKKKIDIHFETLKSFETGKASEKICNLILECINK